MREKLQTLPVAVLKEMAKKQGIKGATALRKAELIEALCNAAEENIGHETAVPENSQPTRTSYQNRGQNGRPAAARRNNNAQGEQQSYQNRQNQNGEQTYQNRQAQNGEQPYQNRQNQNNEQPAYQNNRDEVAEKSQEEMDSGVPASGILEVMPDGFGFIRCENFLPGENDVYVSPTQIRRFNLKTGDIINGNRRVKTSNEKFAALLYIKNVNGYPVSALERRPNFEDLTPIFPNSRLHMETQGKSSTAMRVLDLLAPIGKGQRGMIVSPPKAVKAGGPGSHQQSSGYAHDHPSDR